MRGLLGGVLALFYGAALLGFGTDGFRAFTSEAARRLAVAETPRPLPGTALEDAAGRTFTVGDYAGGLVLVAFIYTGCPDICTTVGDSFAQLQRALPASLRGRAVSLVSISFDPRDRPADLAAYARRYDARDDTWRMARVIDDRARRNLLEAFGVVAIPDGVGGFVHNAAIHLVDRQGRLARIVDYDRPDLALAEVWSLL